MQSAGRQHDDVLRREPRKDGSGEVLPELVHADACRLAVGVDARGAKSGQMVVPILNGDVVERRGPGPIRREDQRVQGERSRSVPSREAVDDLLQVARRGCGHRGLPAAAVGVALGAAAGTGVLGAGAGGDDGFGTGRSTRGPLGVVVVGVWPFAAGRLAREVSWGSRYSPAARS